MTCAFGRRIEGQGRLPEASARSDRALLMTPLLFFVVQEPATPNVVALLAIYSLKLHLEVIEKVGINDRVQAVEPFIYFLAQRIILSAGPQDIIGSADVVCSSKCGNGVTQDSLNNANLLNTVAC